MRLGLRRVQELSDRVRVLSDNRPNLRDLLCSDRSVNRLLPEDFSVNPRRPEAPSVNQPLRPPLSAGVCSVRLNLKLLVLSGNRHRRPEVDSLVRHQLLQVRSEHLNRNRALSGRAQVGLSVKPPNRARSEGARHLEAPVRAHRRLERLPPHRREERLELARRRRAEVFSVVHRLSEADQVHLVRPSSRSVDLTPELTFFSSKGQSKPANPFGASSAAPAFGQPAPTNASPFGGGLGQTSTAHPAANPFATSGVGTSLFGQPAQPAQQQQQQSAGGLFGGGAAGGAFGSANQGSAFGAGGSSLFNKPVGTGTGLFGSTQTQPAQQAGGGLFGGGGLNLGGQTAQPGQMGFGASNAGNSVFGGSTNVGGFGTGGGLFGSNQQLQQSQQAQPQPTLQASLDQNAYGNDPIFANIPPPGAAAVLSLQKKAPPINASPARAVHPNTKIVKLRGFSKPNSSPFSPAKQSPLSFSAGIGSAASSPGLASEDTTLSPAAFRSRTSAKKLLIQSGQARERSSTLDANGATPPPPASKNPIKSHPVFNADAETRALESASPRKAAPPASTSPAQRPEPAQPKPPPSTRQAVKEPEANATASPSVAEDEESASDGQYSLSPALSVLTRMSARELSNLKDFEVARKGFGRVRFLEPVDLNSIEKLGDIVGTHLNIDQANVSVDECPALQGIPAFVTLYGCWTFEKSSRQPLKDAGNQRVVQFERRVRA